MEEKTKPLSPKEVAKELGVHPNTVLRGLRDGTIDGCKIQERGRWLVPRRELDRLRGEGGE